MKSFDVEFYRHHDRLPDAEIKMKMQGVNIEHLLPRIKRILRELDKLPNPKGHTEWLLRTIKENLEI